MARYFQAYRRPIETVTYFKYLGRVMTELENDCTEVVGNLWKARKIWNRPTRILGREGAIPRVLMISFKAVAQVVLLFGLEKWVMTPCMGWVLGGFQQRVSIWITGR